MRNETKAVPVRVICPDCGPQEHRGHLSPVYLFRTEAYDPKKHHITDCVYRIDYVPREGASRFVDPDDDSCPKCGTRELMPVRTDLAVVVNIAATSYFEKELIAARRKRMAIVFERAVPHLMVAE